VGGDAGEQGAKKVRIPDSSAVVKAIAEGTITWERDPDFGYEVATSVPGIEDPELLRPRLLYHREGRDSEHSAIVQRLNKERWEYLANFPGLDPSLIAAIGS
jgi:phosphoenolpyruvate carboxykinase (ATP)